MKHGKRPKLKQKLFLKANKLYLLHWFSEKDRRYQLNGKPMFSIANGDQVGILKKTYRP